MTISAQLLQQNAEQAASTLPQLLIDANQVASTVSLGCHGLRRSGPGDTFWQFRQYDQSDPSNVIDWRQTARFDTVYVRDREWDASQTSVLWCDASPSMAFRSSNKVPTKSVRAAVVGLGLAVLILKGGERVRMLEHGPTASSGRLALIQMAQNLERAITFAEPSTIPVAPPWIPRHASVVLISDFLCPIKEIERALMSYYAHASGGYLLQVLDPAEESMPYRGRIRFHGLEEEGTLLVERTEDVRKEYLRRLEEHRNGLRSLTERMGWGFSIHHTDKPPHTALTALHMRLADQGC